MTLSCHIAETRAQVMRSRALIAEVYHHHYGVVFSETHYDLDAKIEPWPHRYVVVRHDDELIATSGLYLHDTYVQRYGDVSDADIAARLASADTAVDYAPSRCREISKVVVSRPWQGRGISEILVAAAFSRSFVQVDATAPYLLLMCARRSIWERVFHRQGIHTRLLKPFPVYPAHDRYRSPDDPMDSRLIVPDLDIPSSIYETCLPFRLDARSRCLP